MSMKQIPFLAHRCTLAGIAPLSPPPASEQSSDDHNNKNNKIGASGGTEWSKKVSAVLKQVTQIVPMSLKLVGKDLCVADDNDYDDSGKLVVELYRTVGDPTSRVKTESCTEILLYSDNAQ